MFKVRVAYVSRDRELKWSEFKGDRRRAFLCYEKLRHGAERIQVLKGEVLLFELKAEVIETDDWQGVKEFMK